MEQQTKPQRTLLIVDDEQELVSVLFDEFEPLGIRCIGASSGREGLKSLQAESPDAILSDIKMPDLTGLEMLSEIRALGFQTPLILLSGFGDKEKVVEALRLGANDFLDKPYNKKQLHASVKKALELGARLKTLEEELDRICEADPPEAKKSLRDIKREILIMRANREVYFKKSS